MAVFCSRKMATNIAEALDSHSNIVVHDWVEDPSNTVEVGHTENVTTEGNSGDKRRHPVWTQESTHWLMEEMKQFEVRDDRHQIKKRAMYEELADKFSEANFNIHWEGIQKKWQNLMSTYWRNLKKPKKAGQWEYFNEMDIILRNTTIWVGLNGCKDPNVPSSLYYTDQQEDRVWSTERILLLLEEMRQLDVQDDHRGCKNKSVFHKISNSFHRLGVDIDWKAIQKKWHNLMSTYKRNLRKPREEVIWEYYDAMDSVARNINAYYRHMGVPDSSEFAQLDLPAAKGNADENLWTHDNTLWLMEEMLAVKERKEKHLLKNRVVFREIADTFNAEHFRVDWKQVLKKWQSMYILYSKIMRGIMQPGQWQYFERMHDIVGDTDMYVGVGAKKCDDQTSDVENPPSEEKVYRYINPEDNSQIILTSGQPLSTVKAEQQEQYLEFSPHFVTAEYVVASGSSPADENDAEQFTVEIATSDVGILNPDGNLVSSKFASMESTHSGENSTRTYQYEVKNGDGVDAIVTLPTVLSGEFVLEDGVRGRGVVVDEHVEDGGSTCMTHIRPEVIEVEMEEDESEEDDKVMDDVACTTTIESIMESNDITAGEDIVNFENEQALFEISEIGFTNVTPPATAEKVVHVQNNKLTFSKSGLRKRRMLKYKEALPVSIKFSKK